jgi:hypothetical protein
MSLKLEVGQLLHEKSLGYLRVERIHFDGTARFEFVDLKSVLYSNFEYPTENHTHTYTLRRAFVEDPKERFAVVDELYIEDMISTFRKKVNRLEVILEGMED